MGIKKYSNLDLYYNDDSQWGDYQYTTLKDLVNDFMFEITDDSNVKNVNRNKVVYHAKKVVQELYFDVANEVISTEFELNPSLIIAIPHDFVQYVMIGWVGEDGKKHPMAMDNSHNLARAYLQDDQYNYLYDDQGDILWGSHIQDTETLLSNKGEIDELLRYNDFRHPDFNLDRSKLFKNGSYTIDKDRGLIQFSSSVEGRTIFLDYISDGLFQLEDSEIKLHKEAAMAALDYIYWALIKRNKNIPRNEKEGARRDYFNSRRIAKRRIKPIRYEEIRQVMKAQDKMIKG